MTGSILELAREDWKFLSSEGGFQTTCVFTSKYPNPGGGVFVFEPLDCIAMKHHLGVGTDGEAVNTKNAHITFSEGVLKVGESVRDDDGEVDMIGFLVEYKDSTGVSKKYQVAQNFADETVGIVTCILVDYE